MNKKQPAGNPSPAGKPGKKRKSNGISGSQADTTPTKSSGVTIRHPGALPWPKKPAFFDEVLGRSPKQPVRKPSTTKHPKASSTSPQKVEMANQIIINATMEPEEIVDDEPQLPELPRPQTHRNAEQATSESQAFPTSDMLQNSTEYQISEVELGSDEPEIPSTPRTNVETLITIVKNMTPGTVNENKNEIIKRLNDLATHDSTTPRAALHRDPVDLLKDRLRAMENGMRMTVDKIPDSYWSIYRKKLIKMVETKPVLEMNFEQRLLTIMDVVYLNEELTALETGEWKRLEAAIRICAAMAEVTGPDDEIVPVEAETWVQNKLKDIVWLKKVAAIRDKYTDDADGDVGMEG